MTGLITSEAKKLQTKYGKNELTPQKKESFLHKVFRIVTEPMFMLLLVVAVIYFILGEPRDGAIMFTFVFVIIGIDVVQELRTDRTLNALKNLSTPQVTVIRDGKETEIASIDLVPGDLILVHEGVKIPADGTIIKCSDFSVDESSLTGEAEAVVKHAVDDTNPSGDYWRKDYCYAGTLVMQGSATVRVDKIGTSTEYGKIGSSVATAPKKKTPLQRQISGLVKWCAIAALILSVLVGTITFINLSSYVFIDRVIKSVLSGMTLAMAMIPEEFPVILVVFLSLGAWRLAKKHSLIRKLPAVETLGAVSVLCVDKTGTITMNQMSVQDTWAANSNTDKLCEMIGLSCEVETYDQMEKAILSYCKKMGYSRQKLFTGELITEYTFTNASKMMGHIWQRKGKIILAVKGSPEKILSLCKLTNAEKATAKNKIEDMTKQGLRVIAIAKNNIKNQNGILRQLTDYSLSLCGLVGLADPPRETVARDIAICYQAGIRVVMITGDNGVTATAIANKIGIRNSDAVMTGDMLDKLSDKELREKVKTISIFSRVIPEHKMRIVKAFKSNGDIVAMTGDGVNDAPALKYADIGIAMGKRGSQVSREAADLILMDDNFSTIVDTVRDGRRIYDNIRKAVGYVLAIHIPIALASLLAPVLGIHPTSLLLLPLHIVLLELIIDPTCSIVLERQPAEPDIMERGPRNPKEKLINMKMLIKSILQGLFIFGASFATYLIMLPHDVEVARSMGLAIIMLSSFFLVVVNSSEYSSAFTSIKYLLKDKIIWFITIGALLGLAIIIYTPLSGVFRLSALSLCQVLSTVGAAFVAVFWYEIVKAVKRLLKTNKKEQLEGFSGGS